MKPGLLCFVSLVCLLLATTVPAAVPTTINDFFLPGSQPNQSGNIENPDRCLNCHANYSTPVEPGFNWQGSMMAQAARDPLFDACLAIANQDAPQSGDLCIRCHSPKGWLEGRSLPTDGSALTTADREGVQCDFCHRLVKPSPIGVNPYAGDPNYTSGTYPADQTYLGVLSPIPGTSANGMYIVHSDANSKRGPYVNTVARHSFLYSPFHNDAAICGTCHDVSNPAFTKNASGGYSPNAFDAQAPDFNLRTMFPIERTYSEWLLSAYNTPAGVYAPQFGGTKDTVRTCQDCHMRDVVGKGCDKADAPLRTDLGLHDLTGGNTFIPKIVNQAYPGQANLAALDSGIVRARRMLQLAASVQVTAQTQAGGHLVNVRVVNETAHKLPSGYPEGRRIWVNVKAYNSSNVLIYESCAYDTATAVLSHDPDAKIYEIKPGLSQSIAPVVGYPAGVSFHFVLNDTIYNDNRIPPRGFTNAGYDSIQSPPVGYVYADGQYWDDTPYLIPGSASRVTATLYYQTTTKEYVEFLRDANTTNTAGQTLYNLWAANGKSAPEVMTTQTLLLTPVAGNQAPILVAIGPKTVNEGVLLSFGVSATDPDGTTPVLSTSSLPSGANFVNNGNGTGTFNWTPTFEQAGIYNVTFYATDDSSAVDSEVVAITVNNVNRAPVLAAIGPKSVDENTPLSFGVSATDPDGTIPALSVLLLPSGAAFTDNGNGTGSFSWTPTYAQAGVYDVVFRASDGVAIDSERVEITVVNVNQPPVLAAIGPRSVAEGVLLQIAVSATDPDGTVLTLAADSLPANATFVDYGGGSGSFSFVPSYEQAGTYAVIFRVSDGNLADSERVEITVTNTNRPPLLAAIGPRSVTAGSTLQFTVTSADPDGTIPSLAATGLPTGATFTDNGNGSGTFGWTPDLSQVGTVNVLFTASDGALSDSESVPITVTTGPTNDPPVFETVGDQEVIAGRTIEVILRAQDPDGDAVTLAVVDPPANSEFSFEGWNATEQRYRAVFTWTPSMAQAGVHDILFTASDPTHETGQWVTFTVSAYLCGDVSNDGAGPNVADLTYLVSFLFRGGPAPAIPEASDMNGDGSTIVSDLTYLVSFLFKGGAEPTCGGGPAAR